VPSLVGDDDAVTPTSKAPLEETLPLQFQMWFALIFGFAFVVYVLHMISEVRSLVKLFATPAKG